MLTTLQFCVVLLMWFMYNNWPVTIYHNLQSNHAHFLKCIFPVSQLMLRFNLDSMHIAVCLTVIYTYTDRINWHQVIINDFRVPIHLLMSRYLSEIETFASSENARKINRFPKEMCENINLSLLVKNKVNSDWSFQPSLYHKLFLLPPL